MNNYLMPALEFTPGLVKKVFDSVPAAAIDQPTHPDRFTPREVVAHLADWEPILLRRMQQCVSSPGSTIQPYDEGAMAVENGYAGQNPVECAAKFKAARQATIAWLSGLSPDEWQQSAVHPERGVLSVADIANSLVCHDVYHLKQLANSD